MSLIRTYQVVISPVRSERMEKFYRGELAMLASINFDQLSHEDQIDHEMITDHFLQFYMGLLTSLPHGFRNPFLGRRKCVLVGNALLP